MRLLVRGMAGGSEFLLPFGLHRKPDKGEAPALRPIFPRKEAIVLAFVHLPTMQQQKLHSSPRSVIHPRPVLIGSPVVFPPAQYVDLGTPNNATRTVAAVPSPAVQRARMDVSSARERDFSSSARHSCCDGTRRSVANRTGRSSCRICCGSRATCRDRAGQSPTTRSGSPLCRVLSSRRHRRTHGISRPAPMRRPRHCSERR